MKLSKVSVIALLHFAGVSTANELRGSLISEGSEYVAEVGAPPDPMNEGSLIALQFSDDPYLGQDKLQLIVSGKFMLVDVHINQDEEVYGSFCEFDFDQQQRDPSLAPRFIDLYGESRHCQEHHTSLPLHEVAQACREHDKEGDLYSVKPSAFIFHQPRSGSALLTNMITVSQPGTRVISESSALDEILGCQDCSHDKKVHAFQDAVYLLGRTTTERYMYVKFSAAGTVGLPVVRTAFPDTKWIFVNRDADIILQKMMNNRVERRICGVKRRRNPGKAMMNYLTSKGKNIAALETDEQVCAALLASNLIVATQELARDDTSGRLVQYEDLTSRESIKELLEYLGVESPEWDRIEEQRMKKANGGEGDEWNGEADIQVSHQVKSATSEFELSDM